jgi:hypothetical protein
VDQPELILFSEWWGRESFQKKDRFSLIWDQDEDTNRLWCGSISP